MSTLLINKEDLESVWLDILNPVRNQTWLHLRTEVNVGIMNLVRSQVLSKTWVRIQRQKDQVYENIENK